MATDGGEKLRSVDFEIYGHVQGMLSHIARSTLWGNAAVSAGGALTLLNLGAPKMDV